MLAKYRTKLPHLRTARGKNEITCEFKKKEKKSKVKKIKKLAVTFHSVMHTSPLRVSELKIKSYWHCLIRGAAR